MKGFCSSNPEAVREFCHGGADVMDEQRESLIWQWFLVSDGRSFFTKRAWAMTCTADIVAAGSYEAVHAAKRLLSGKAAVR